ncbi:MAG TPA: aldo/keto reductase [Terriglobia bacterium]|nr:aldo/keto reductase [Terriglobia bacterium]
MSKDVSRRKFLGELAIGGAAGVGILTGLHGTSQAATTETLPHRALGKTGESVSILAFGGGSRFGMYRDEEEALAALNRALDLGITYVDTAHAYGSPQGESERRIGKVLKARRKGIFLATKIENRTRDGFLRDLEISLKRLDMDHVDLVHIHSLRLEDDLAKIEAPDGALKGLLEAKEQKMARFIGMTSHTDGPTLAKAIERHPLDCVQMALNAARNGKFEVTALPAARKKNLGIIAMKITGQEFLLGEGPGKTSIDELLRYSLSLPVTTGVIGMPKVADIDHNTALVRHFRRLDEEAMDRIRRQMAPSTEPLTKRLVGHLDVDHQHVCWA